MKQLIKTLTALAVLFACLFPASAQDITLPVPYISQTSPTATALNDCGACAMAMLAAYHGLTFTCDELHYTVFGGHPVLATVSFDDMATLAGRAGIPVQLRYYATVADVDALLNTGRPVGVYVFRDGKGHVLVVYGRVGESYLVHDPAGLVNRVDAAYLDNQFAASWGRVWG